MKMTCMVSICTHELFINSTDHFMTRVSLLGDIIQEGFVDSYNNLTLKTVLMLKWVTKSCANKGD